MLILRRLPTVMLYCPQYINVYQDGPLCCRNPAQKGLLPLFEMAHLVNMLIVVRFLRIIPKIKVL